MSYNFLRDAKYIKNSELCRYDSVHGYSADFSNNGNVSGWDIYNNIYLYGCWNNVLFGTAYAEKCYIGRTEVFLSVNAEKYFFIEFLLKVIDANPNKVVKGLKKGKIMWKRSDDNDWAEDRSLEFEITDINSWCYYKLSLGPYKWWQGDINDLRFYPFIDGHSDDKFFLKSLRITSEDFWTCTNTNCSYYQFYTHPCPGSGKRAFCEAKSYKKKYTTISGINSELLLNIDDYGYERIELGTNYSVPGNDMVKIIGNSISTINIGGYSYSLVECTDNSTIRLYSGTSRNDSSVKILYTPAAEELGFFINEEPNYEEFLGEDPATGFDYASTRLLQTFELNALLDGSDNIAYVHNPTQYSVEGGRRDFNEIGVSKLISELDDYTGYISFNNSGKTIVDMSKRIDNNGKLKHFWVYGIAYSGAQFKILRPHNDGSFTVVFSIDIPTERAGTLYTARPIVSRVDCDVLVNKGDLLGVYNVDLYVGQTLTNLPDATFAQFDGDIYGNVTKQRSYSYGVGGFALYARGDLKQNNTILDIDLGYRLNVSEFIVKGEELEGFYEFNIASCLDVTWNVDLFGEKHRHSGYYRSSGYRWTVEHTNIYYGKECLDDLVITADNGQAGTTYGSNNGLATYGADHSYFYVNGDAEWLYSYDCADIVEFCGNTVPDGPPTEYERDPVAFTLYFPDNRNFDVFKSIMYFKEEDNFRKFALSTYNGPYYYKGNADNQSFTLVPKYTNVYINGTKYLEGDDTNIDKYLFKNPTTDDIASQDYDDLKKVDDHIATHFVDWTIIAHEFEPVTCKGFRIYCNKHHSTKITELELYSRVENDVSMVDNAILYFSDYQDLWRTSGFRVRDDKTTYAFIGGTPRYIRLTLESQTKFNMRELSINVTDQTFVYDEVILLEDTRRNHVGRSKAIAITNTYNKAFDLTIDIPRDLGSNASIVFWNKLSSMDNLSNTEFGPACLLYKSNDFPITFFRGQCASDCFVYGLADLVNNKHAYYTNNTFDWYYYGKVYKGISIDFINYNYLDTSKYTCVLSSAASSKYWRLYGLSSDRVIKISDLIAQYNNNRVQILNILLPLVLQSSGRDYVISNGVAFESIPVFSDRFSIGISDDFIVSGSNGPTSSLVDNSHLYINANGGTIIFSTYTLDKNYQFEFDLHYRFDDNTSSMINMAMTFEFYSGNTRVFYIQWITSTSYNLYQNQCTSSYHTVNIYSNDVKVFTSSTLGCYFNMAEYNKLNIRRAGRYVSLYMEEKDYITTFQIDNLGIDRFVITTNNYIDYLTIYKVQFLYSLLLSQGTYIDLELLSNNPVDTFYLIGTGTSLTVDIYTSYNRTTYQLTRQAVTERFTLYSRFAIDLEKRHSLSIVRDYGVKPYKIDLSLQLNTTFSNSYGSIENAVFDSTKDDCRWLGLEILNSTMQLKELDTIGIYSDISKIYCEGGGINNTWEELPQDITRHTEYINVSNNKLVTTNTYYKNHVPENAVDGRMYEYEISYCWGFLKGTTPILYIELGEEYTVGAFKIHSGYNPNINLTLNTSYRLSLDNTVSGTAYNYVVVKSISGVTDNSVKIHEFTPVKARRAKLEILTFTTIPVYEQNDNFSNVIKELGFLREVEILAKEDLLHISSEEYPIICINLRDSFNLVGHKLFNRYRSITTTPDALGNNMWDNKEEFFSYSDSFENIPSKVSFEGGKEYVNIYLNNLTTGNLVGSSEYFLETAIGFPKGLIFIEWEAYYPESVGEISLHLIGSKEYIQYATSYGTDWVKQYNEVNIEYDGIFSIYFKQNIDSTRNWGFRNIKIYRLYGLTKWVSIKRDTATNYSYDFTSNKFGIDYLGTVEFYGDTKYVPTEYWWWWSTQISILSNDPINTKVGKRSLVLNYPESYEIETLRLREADILGIDYEWSIYDSLSFYWYIDNIYNLDTSFGQVVFGSIKNSSTDFYYSWDISKISLDTGWNEVILNFNEYTAVYPTTVGSATKYLSNKLNIQDNSTNLSSLYIQFRGIGNKLSMCFDDFRIKRNTFITDVKHDKGICLTYTDYLMVPLSNVTLDKGSVEFWVKMGVNSLSMDAFGVIHSATLFTISSNTNDIIALRIKPGNWFEVFAGNVRRQALFSVDELPSKSHIKRDQVIHIGLVWSNDGTATDAGHTIKLFINNSLTLTSFSKWEVSDTKLSYFKLGGGIAQTAQIYDTKSAFIFENLKIYNYCKTSFSMNTQDIDNEIMYSPENFIEISRDDIEYLGLGSENLPIVFEQVPAGESRTVFVRAIKNNKFSANNSTAQIVLDWLTTV